MKYKENIGNYLSSLGLYRLEYLNNEILKPSLCNLVNYLNEFEGMHAFFDEVKYCEDQKQFISQIEHRFRLSIFYPNDIYNEGKNIDRLDRRFILDIFFSKEGLNFLVHYNRRFGFPLQKIDPSDSVLKSIEEKKETQKKDIKDSYKKLSDWYKKRDIYEIIKPISESLDEEFICDYIFYLYIQYIENIKSKNERV